MACGPNPAHYLLLLIKFYWYTATPICLHHVHAAFLLQGQELNRCEEAVWSIQLKISGSLWGKKNVSNLVLKQNFL